MSVFRTPAVTSLCLIQSIFPFPLVRALRLWVARVAAKQPWLTSFLASTANLRASSCLDGIPVTAEEDLPAWQANCALVPQDIRLLDTSVRENIAFGQSGDDIDDDEVWNALAAAQFDDVVSQMPYGLYTMIGENGVKLSGGQRQRLLLGSCFLSKGKVLDFG